MTASTPGSPVSLTGANLDLGCTRNRRRAHAGIVNVSDLVLGAFHSAYLGYYGMVGFAGAA